MPPRLHITLLGDFSLVDGGTPITGVDTPRLQSLLAYLLLHRDAPQARQQLAYLFWPDSTEKQARTNLRRELHNLRHALPEPDRYLAIGTSTLQWRPNALYTLDVDEFEAAIAAGRRAEQSTDGSSFRSSLAQAAATYRGDLLPGCYDDWITGERERLRGLSIWALGQLVSALEEAHDYAAATRYAERVLTIDPLHDTACRALMRLHALNGQRASALRAYRAYAARLEEEFGVEPDPDTRALYQQLLTADTAVTPPVVLPGITPLVGRVAEWGQLLRAWRVSVQGHGQLALIEGEAGIGKSRLAEELRTWASRQGIATAAARSYAAEGEHVYAPVVEWLRSAPLRAARARVNALWLSELSRLLPELRIEHPDLPRPDPVSAGSERRRLAEALAHAFRAVDRPLLLVLDDLQWTDRETIEWLRYLFHHEADMCLLVVGTARPEELRSDPLAALTRELGNSDQFTQIALGPLDSHETSTLAADIAGDALAADQATTIYRETEGNPLFIVETVRAGAPVARGSQESPSGSMPLPPKISAVIAARLAQLSPPARELAALAATIGRAFSLEVLLGASPEDDETVVAALDELCARHIVRERGQDVYDFSHDKLRDVAYAEISAARRQLLHRRVARAIETVQAHNLEAVSAQLAAHYRQGGLPVEAIRFYELAGERSLRLSAYQDGIAHIQQALELLARLPASQAHAQQEARLQTALGVALMATKGWPTAEVGEAYGRARALYQPGGDALDRARLIWGLWGFHIVRGELATARELGERERALAEARNDPNLLLVSGIHLGTSLYHLGDLATARTLLEQAIALYDPEQHRAHASRFGPDLGVFGLAYLSHVLWQLGYPDRALARSRESIALARARAHPYSVAIALDYAAMLAQFRRDRAEVRALADEAIGLSRKQEFAYYLAWGEFLRAWSLDTRSRLAAMREALAALRATGAGLRGTYYFTLLAQAYLEAGQPGDGLNALTEAWDQQREHDERYWEPELHRTQAEILLAQGAPAHVVEQHLQDALASAKSQGAVSLELRAAASLGRLWRDRGMGTEAHELLTALVCRVSEGLDTPDLVETRALLRQIVS